LKEMQIQRFEPLDCLSKGLLAATGGPQFADDLPASASWRRLSEEADCLPTGPKSARCLCQPESAVASHLPGIRPRVFHGLAFLYRNAI
jgi:hypothetical protein